MTLRSVARIDDVWDGEMRGFVVGDAKVLVIRLGDSIYAYRDRCAHLGVALSEGRLDGHVVTCAAHHYQYDARTGEGINPRSTKLVPYRVVTDGGAIYVDLDA